MGPTGRVVGFGRVRPEHRKIHGLGHAPERSMAASSRNAPRLPGGPEGFRRTCTLSTQTSAKGPSAMLMPPIRKTRTDPRGQAFNAEYEKAKAKLSGCK